METTSKKTTRQYWRQTATSKPWWPWGIAPLAGLGVLFLVGALFMAPRIEAEVRDQVSEQVNAAGLPAFDVRSDGQIVTISTPVEGEHELYVHAVAASTQCDTWAGRLDCPTSVDVRRIEKSEAVEKPDTTAVLVSRPHSFTAERVESSVRLSGEVPDLEEQDRILGVAGQHFDDIENLLSITNESAGSNYGLATNQALAVVSHLSSGAATWSGETLSVRGSANADDVAVVRDEFGAFGSESLQGEFNVRTLMGHSECDTDFDRLLSKTSIRFQTSSATIDAGSDELLDQLAALAKSCPGNLTVQGHTDSRGDAAGNQALSFARASAVRDALATRGIESSRLLAKGFGESQPIADNTTLAGRAKNRRIEISTGEIQ